MAKTEGRRIACLSSVQDKPLAQRTRAGIHSRLVGENTTGLDLPRCHRRRKRPRRRPHHFRPLQVPRGNRQPRETIRGNK
jgi:hypothetical protein